jgi:hypothetical protein
MSVHPIALLVAVVVAAALVLLPRDRLLPPFFLVAVFLPLSQGFDVVGLDITFARFLIFTVWFRFLVRGELALSWNPMDTALCLWCGIGAVAYVLLWGTPEAFISSMGQVVNYAGTYFFIRTCIRQTDDVVHLTKYMRFSVIALGVVMLAEWLTGRNAFAIFGGVPAITEIRDGHLRCQGPFGHPIGAGLFGASLVPIFVSSVVGRYRREQSLLAIVSGILVVALAASSGPVLALVAGATAWCLWPLRRRMRAVSWGIVAALFGLHLVMKAPVWALIARASVFDSSSSWHRLNLIDQFINRFDEWWLVGTRSTEHWGFYAADVANNYVRIGVGGGVFTLLAYLLLLRRGFTSIGRAIRASNDPAEQTLLWGLGGALTAHVIGSFGLSYWDQSAVLFALLLGLISAASSVVREASPARSKLAPVDVSPQGFAAAPRQTHP